MVFNNRIKEVQKLVYDGFNIIFNSIAKFLGYPDVPGMPIFPLDSKSREQFTVQDLLPKHITEILSATASASEMELAIPTTATVRLPASTNWPF